MVTDYKVNGISPENRLREVDNQIAEANREFLLYGEKLELDPRAIEIVRAAKRDNDERILPIGYRPRDKMKELTNMFANGYSEKDYQETLKLFDYPGNNGEISELDPYQSVNLKNFFNLSTEGKAEVLSKWEKAKKLGKKVVPLVIAAAIAATPAAGAGDVAPANNTVTEDMYDDTQKWFESFYGQFLWNGFQYPETFIDYCDCFKAINKPLDEPIKTPDEIMKILEDKKYFNDEFGYYNYGEIDVSPTDAAAWMASGFESNGRMCRLASVDIDDDGKPEILMPTTTKIFSRLAFEDLQKHQHQYIDVDNKPEVLIPIPRKGLVKLYVGRSLQGNELCYPELSLGVKKNQYCVLDSFNIPKGYYSAVNKLKYTNNSWKIIVPDKGSFTVGWKDVVGKTPAEIGLDKDDREVHDFKAKEIPGFEGLAALGAGAVAYLGRKYRNKK